MARQSGSTTSGGKGVASRVSVVVSTTEPPARKGKLWFDTADTPTPIGGVRDMRTETANYTAVLTDDVILVDASGGAVTITLPAAADRTGKQYDIKKIDSSGNAVTIDGDGSETIDDSLTNIIGAQYNSVTIVSDGTEWWII